MQTGLVSSSDRWEPETAEPIESRSASLGPSPARAPGATALTSLQCAVTLWRLVETVRFERKWGIRQDSAGNGFTGRGNPPQPSTHPRTLTSLPTALTAFALLAAHTTPRCSLLLLPTPHSLPHHPLLVRLTMSAWHGRGNPRRNLFFFLFFFFSFSLFLLLLLPFLFFPKKECGRR